MINPLAIPHYFSETDFFHRHFAAFLFARTKDCRRLRVSRPVAAAFRRLLF
jgi:hypothetical protein